MDAKCTMQQVLDLLDRIDPLPRLDGPCRMLTENEAGPIHNRRLPTAADFMGARHGPFVSEQVKAKDVPGSYYPPLGQYVDHGHCPTIDPIGNPNPAVEVAEIQYHGSRFNRGEW